MYPNEIVLGMDLYSIHLCSFLNRNIVTILHSRCIRSHHNNAVFENTRIYFSS